MSQSDPVNKAYRKTSDSNIREITDPLNFIPLKNHFFLLSNGTNAAKHCNYWCC